MRLEGKVALITGATGGMVSSSARLFAKEGAVVLVSGRDRDEGEALVKEITDGGGRAVFVELDTTDYGQWDDAVSRTESEFGGLHVLMNVVGTNDLTVIPDTDPKEWNRIFEVNVTSTMVGIQTCAPLMKESGGGSIINIGSVAGLTGAPGGAYSASKWALEGLSRHAAYVLADWGIRSNVIQPGFIETKMTAAIKSNPIVKRMAKKQMSDQVLLRRAGNADEIGYTALFLASDESSYITGTDIVVDGGWVTAAPYLSDDRRHHMLQILRTKEAVEEKRDAVEEFLRRHL
jgi:NAD(P)-dependent dehydrogenase (short-subunit alcohol dehydrogenase family)